MPTLLIIILLIGLPGWGLIIWNHFHTSKYLKNKMLKSKNPQAILRLYKKRPDIYDREFLLEQLIRVSKENPQGLSNYGER